MPPSLDTTKWGINQMSNPAPLWYRRFTNAMIACFVPVYTGFIDFVRMDDYTRSICLHIGVVIPVIMKGIGMVMGNGQIYFPSNEAIDKENKNTKNNIMSIIFVCLLFLFTTCILSLLK